MGQTPITGSARRLMNYLSTEWADGIPGAPGHPHHAPPPEPASDPKMPSSAARLGDLTPAKRRLSQDSPVDLTLSPKPQPRARRLKLRLAHHVAARNSSPAPIRVPPPGDSSDEQEEEYHSAGMDVQNEASGERVSMRESRGKRLLHEEDSINTEVGLAAAGPSHAAKRNRSTYSQHVGADPHLAADSRLNSLSGVDTDCPADPRSLFHQASGGGPQPADYPTPPSAFSPSPLPSTSLPASFPQASLATPPPTGLKSFVADLLSQLPPGAGLQQHGAVLQGMLQGDIGVQPKLAAVHQAFADLSETIEDKTEQLMGSYAQLLQQYMVKVKELEAVQASLRDRDAQLEERESIIQQLQTALLDAQTSSASSFSALAAARQEAEQSKEALQQEVLCQICFEKRKSVLLMPCLHFLYCQDCVSRCFQQNTSRTCPTCRTAVAGTMNVHLQAS